MPAKGQTETGWSWRTLRATSSTSYARRHRRTRRERAPTPRHTPQQSRCGVFEDLAHGIETEQGKYVDKSLAAMEWLFPP
jgi:hypothetical protein